MHDINFIRSNPGAFDAAMRKRKFNASAQEVLALDAKNRSGITQMQQLQERANQLAKQIGALMAQGKKDEAEAAKAESKKIKEDMTALKNAEEKGDEANAELTQLLAGIPNALLDEVPEGADEHANKEVRRWGEPKQIAGACQHDEIGEALRLMEFSTTAKISGARFTTMLGKLAQLERALAAFMLGVHTQEFGYMEAYAPVMVRANALFGTSQLPKFEEDLFKTTDDRYLIPTAEVSLTNLVRERIIPAEKLPIRLTAYTPCFRSEAGSAGKDTRGMIRQHQFGKVELVSITAAEQVADEHERMTLCAETILQRLELPYRVMLLCSGDTGFASQKTYDIEVWMPGQNAYREISSCSRFGEFQARRMQARYREQEGSKPKYVHTLNGSALAVGRTIVAILENYQQKDGSVVVPVALRPFMNGLEVITPETSTDWLF